MSPQPRNTKSVAGIREELKHKQFSFTEIAKKVGENWQALSCEQKGQYEARAASAKEKYHQEMMSYKTTDGYREYQRYLNDFKIKHGSNTGKNLYLCLSYALRLARRRPTKT